MTISIFALKGTVAAATRALKFMGRDGAHPSRITVAVAAPCSRARKP